MNPNASEWIRTGLSKSENFKKLAKTQNKLWNFRKISRKSTDPLGSGVWEFSLPPSYILPPRWAENGGHVGFPWIRHPPRTAFHGPCPGQVWVDFRSNRAHNRSTWSKKRSGSWFSRQNVPSSSKTWRKIRYLMRNEKCEKFEMAEKSRG